MFHVVFPTHTFFANANDDDAHWFCLATFHNVKSFKFVCHFAIGDDNNYSVLSIIFIIWNVLRCLLQKLAKVSWSKELYSFWDAISVSVTHFIESINFSDKFVSQWEAVLNLIAAVITRNPTKTVCPDWVKDIVVENTSHLFDHLLVNRQTAFSVMKWFRFIKVTIRKCEINSYLSSQSPRCKQEVCEVWTQTGLEIGDIYKWTFDSFSLELKLKLFSDLLESVIRCDNRSV